MSPDDLALSSPAPAPATLGESAAPPRQNRLVPNQERWPLDPQKPVLELDNVSIGFGGRPVLSGLSLQIVPGKTTVIVGRSGSGKSVLLKLMMGLLRPHSGKVIAFGRDLTKVSQLELLELRKRMGMLFQNYALFDALSVEDNVGFPLRENSRLPQREISTLSRELINILGLGGSEHLLPAELSGGMKKRVSLARALVFNPEVVLFDEPTTGLDPIMIEKVDEMIALASKRYQITSVIISHDMASTARLADRVAFLHEGQIVFLGSYQEFRACTLPPVQSFVAGAQTSRLGASVPDGPDMRGAPAAPTFAHGADATVDEADAFDEEVADGANDGANDADDDADADRDLDDEDTRPALQAAAPAGAGQVTGGYPGGLTGPLPADLVGVAPAVELVGVYKQFGGKHVLRGIDLAIYPKKTTVLIGASGSGKSVIIKHIMGLFKPTRGQIKVFGQDIVPLGEDQMNAVRSRFGLVFQHAALLDWLSVYGNVEFPLKERRVGTGQQIREQVLEILERLNITDIMHRMPGEISEGQKKRVGLARAIVMKPEILIYDEPTTGQDPLRTRDIDDMIEETQRRFDITSIVISHDMASTFRIAHMVAMLHQGHIAAYGTPEQLLASTNPQVQHFIHAGAV